MNILNKLTIKHLKMNKKRTAVTIVGVILSSALMVGIGLLFSTMRENLIQTTILHSGTHHVTIRDVESKQVSQLEKNAQIEVIEQEQLLGYQKLEIDNINFVAVKGISENTLKKLDLIEGRLPKNKDEIVLTKQAVGKGFQYEIGDEVTLELGYRIDSKTGEEISEPNTVSEREIYQSGEKKTYRVVGIVNNVLSERYGQTYVSVYTLPDLKKERPLTLHLTYYSVDQVYEKTDKIAKNLGFTPIQDMKYEYEEVKYNESYLSVLGHAKYGNATDAIMGIVAVVLSLISIACIIVIYNSFAISVMERKKQFGLFSSIGTTKKQLRHTVFFEAFIVGIIGIPLGILGGYFGIWCVLEVVNYLLPDVFETRLVLTTYPPLVLLPILFMVIVILLSAYLPAKKAGKVTPIEAIRQNDDIKIKGKKVRTPKWVRKVFGIEGEIALKNMKRNKKKYRITIVSLFISIVLFVSFSSLLEYGLEGSASYLNTYNFDIALTIQDESKENLKGWLEDLKEKEDVEKLSYWEDVYVNIEPLPKSIYNEKMYQIFKERFAFETEDYKARAASLFVLDDKSYEAYKKEIGLKENRPILVNVTNQIYYEHNEDRKTYHGPVFNEEKIKKISLREFDESICKSSPDILDETCYHKDVYVFDDLYYTDVLPFGMLAEQTVPNPVIVVDEKTKDEIIAKFHVQEENPTFISYNAALKVPNDENLDKEFKKIDEDDTLFDQFYYANIKETMRLQNNMILVIKILLYGFICLVTLIGVTSVFNTINTNITLRRKEFAMLRSMGLTPKGFNRILYFESIFFGIKSLFYGYVVSTAIVFLLHTQMTDIVTIGFIMPWKAMGYAAIGVFAIVLLSMFYASKKIRKENILDAIRDENI